MPRPCHGRLQRHSPAGPVLCRERVTTPIWGPSKLLRLLSPGPVIGPYRRDTLDARKRSVRRLQAAPAPGPDCSRSPSYSSRGLGPRRILNWFQYRGIFCCFGVPEGPADRLMEPWIGPEGRSSSRPDWSSRKSQPGVCRTQAKPRRQQRTTDTSGSPAGSPALGTPGAFTSTVVRGVTKQD